MSRKADEDTLLRERARLQMILKHIDEDIKMRGTEFAPATRDSVVRRIAQFDFKLGRSRGG